MNDNYFLDDLIGSLERDVVTERYYPLIAYKGELTAILNKAGAARKDRVSDAVTEDIRMTLGEAVSGLFSRYIHIYDFNESKLREIKGYAGEVKSVFDASDGYARNFTHSDILYTKNNEDIETLLSSRRHVPAAMADDVFATILSAGGEDVNKDVWFSPFIIESSEDKGLLAPDGSRAKRGVNIGIDEKSGAKMILHTDNR